MTRVAKARAVARVAKARAVAKARQGWQRKQKKESENARRAKAMSMTS